MDSTMDPTQAERDALVEQLRAAGIRSQAVLQAIARFPRHELVSRSYREHAYANRPLPIGSGQTISQPYMVAFMTEALAVEAGARVLEIGTGSGYQTAILALMGVRVYTLEIVPSLATRASSNLLRLGITGVEIRVGDGYGGWPAAAPPFDGIVVTAAPHFVPPALCSQLRNGGRLIIPIGDEDEQSLEIYEKAAGELQRRQALPVRFVPMTGEAARIGQLH